MTIVEKIRRAGQRRGKREGMQLGLEKGMLQGLQEGRREEAFRIAHTMLECGLEREFISRMTGLSVDEIPPRHH